MFTLIKLKIQVFSRFLSNMIMPNISIFITLGIMTSFFMPLGWFPNQSLSRLISPIINYLLPLLISYTGGRLISGERGGLAGSISTIGVITSTTMPMLLGAMIVGPLAGWSIKIFDKLIEKNIKSGFEMLVNNFSLACVSIFLSIFSFFFIGPLVELISQNLNYIIKIIISYKLLPLISIFIEPAKIFFLNNVINHGILSPLGIQEIINNNSSIFFLIESNPGPGLGVLLAWFFYGKGEFSKTAGGAALIEFLGGVHEIYFSYVLIKPKLIISLILGGMTGVFLLVFLHGGLVSVVSPGSILSILAMTPKGMYFINIISIFFSFLISFISSIILFKIEFKNNKNIHFSRLKDKNTNFTQLKKSNYFHGISFSNVQNIIFACDAGMGSSAMGASLLRKKIKNANLKYISVSNMAIHLLPKHADLVITHYHLTHRAKIYSPHAQHISLKTFLNHSLYDSLVNELIKNKIIFQNKRKNIDEIKNIKKSFIISEKNIFLNQYAINKEEAIKLVGKYLVEQGYVKLDYIDAMLEREKISSTWLGESIAIPHGTIQSKNSILKTGVIFCQFPKGVHFGDDIDDIAYIVIGIAARNNEHIMVVSSITNALDDKEIIKTLSKTNNIKEVLSFLNIHKV